MTKSWKKLGFAHDPMPWELPGVDSMDRVIFASAAKSMGTLFALRMWEHTATYVDILDKYPDDDEAEPIVREWILSLDKREASEFVSFNRATRALARRMSWKTPRNAITKP